MKMNQKLKVITFVLCGIFALVSIKSCQVNDFDEDIRVTNPELGLFMKSSEFKNVKNAYGIKRNDLQLNESVKVESNDVKDVNIYNVPVMKRGRMVGRLLVVSKADGAVFKTIFENWTAFDTKSGEGEIRIEVNGRFVAKYTSTPMRTRGGASTSVSLKLTDVADLLEASIPRIKTRSEGWPSDDGGWWDCTSRCYIYAKEACGSDDNCDIICDLMNITGLCTGAIAAACAVYCV